MTRRILLGLIFLNIMFGITAQTKLSVEFTEINQKLANPKFTDYSSSKINNVEYIHALGLIDNRFNSTQTSNKGIIIGSIVGNVVTLRIPISMMDKNFSIPGLVYLAPSHKVLPMLNKAVKDTRVDSVQHGYTLSQPFTGKDVFIGITDWGFDYTNPMFYDTNLTHTRIFKAWDQFRTAGPAPSGFNYGTEISGEQSLLQAQCDTFNFYEWATHGSHVVEFVEEVVLEQFIVE
jgi:hypothetical protein